MKKSGPTLTVKASCFNCSHEYSESYAVQSDSGCRVFCEHPTVLSESALGSRKRIGDTTWDTPSWCPLLGEAMAKLMKSP